MHIKVRYVAVEHVLQEDVLFRGTAAYLLEGERSGFGARGDAGPASADVLNYDAQYSKNYGKCINIRI